MLSAVYGYRPPPLRTEPQTAMVRALETLEIGGDKDGPNFPELARHVADAIPNGGLVRLPNIGHLPHFEAPDVFHRELVNFLKDDPTSDAAKR